jgi:ATP-dependent Clp protease protease subunit
MADSQLPDFVHRALERKYLAEAARAEADARRLAADADETEQRAVYATIEAQSLALDWETKQELHLLARNSDHYHRIYRFTKDVESGSVKDCIEALTKWHRIDPGCDITIVFTSPGGSVFSGYALYDHILELRAQGHHVTTICRGYAASMAGILLQAGTTRKMGKESYLMLHEISTMAMGKAFEIADEAAFLEKAMDRVYDIFVSRSGGKITKRKLKALVERRDFWVSSDEALAYGFVDEIEG